MVALNVPAVTLRAPACTRRAQPQGAGPCRRSKLRVTYYGVVGVTTTRMVTKVLTIHTLFSTTSLRCFGIPKCLTKGLRPLDPRPAGGRIFTVQEMHPFFQIIFTCQKHHMSSYFILWGKIAHQDLRFRCSYDVTTTCERR